jgi:hypothetical protein
MVFGFFVVGGGGFFLKRCVCARITQMYEQYVSTCGVKCAGDG